MNVLQVGTDGVLVGRAEFLPVLVKKMHDFLTRFDFNVLQSFVHQLQSRQGIARMRLRRFDVWPGLRISGARSEEHTSELQSHVNLVCRLLLEKKKDEFTIRLALTHAKNVVIDNSLRSWPMKREEF